jgi:Fe-S-cluster-containing dehydrogenase component
VPHYVAAIDQMVKCDMCFDRTSIGKKPMCATVCPSQALFFGTVEEVMRMRKERPVQEFQFGEQPVRTKVKMMSSPGMERMDYDIMEFMPGAASTMVDIAELSVWTSGMETLNVEPA